VGPRKSIDVAEKFFLHLPGIKLWIFQTNALIRKAARHFGRQDVWSLFVAK
jgi:hypothetical protein